MASGLTVRSLDPSPGRREVARSAPGRRTVAPRRSPAAGTHPGRARPGEKETCPTCPVWRSKQGSV